MEASSRAALAEVRERLQELTSAPSGLLEKAKDRITGQERAVSGPDSLVGGMPGGQGWPPRAGRGASPV